MLTKEQVAELRRWFLARSWTYDMTTEEHGATYTVVAATVPDDINALCDTIEELRGNAALGAAVRKAVLAGQTASTMLVWADAVDPYGNYDYGILPRLCRAIAKVLEREEQQP